MTGSLICCRENCGVLFNFSGFTRRPEPKGFEDGIVKYYDNDNIAFEIYSTVLSKAPNKIVDAVDSVYKHNDCSQISRFINELNKIIIEAVDMAIDELVRKTVALESKYHSLYVVAGIIFSKYDIDIEHLTVTKTALNPEIYQQSLDIDQHMEDKWFVDENRQVGFFKKAIGNLLEMKKGDAGSRDKDMHGSAKSEILKIKIKDTIICANTVKEFYKKIFAYLNEQVDLSESIPYATGKKRYLVNWTNRHINGEIFFAPIKIENYYVETHKNKNGALKDIYKYIESIGVDVEYVR